MNKKFMQMLRIYKIFGLMLAIVFLLVISHTFFAVDISSYVFPILLGLVLVFTFYSIKQIFLPHDKNDGEKSITKPQDTHIEPRNKS
jgi:hypothetical protein